MRFYIRNRKIISLTSLLLTASIMAGGCSVVDTVLSDTSSYTTTSAVTTTTEETTTEFPIDPSWYRWDPFTAPRSLPEGELFNRDLPLPEGIDYVYSCSISEGTVLSEDLFGGYYQVSAEREGCAVSCDCEFFFYDRQLTDEEVEAYDSMLEELEYACAQPYNGIDYHAYTVDGIIMGLKNNYPTDEYPDGRAVIVFVSSQTLEDGFIGAG
ncbi:hypothetical protein SAMN06296952_1139 [Oscillospiraceae bacterium]|nr:hypothetical protein SAMN06296952_1139 [Oscillospiraceae bacterium]